MTTSVEKLKMTGSTAPWSIPAEEEYKRNPKLKREDVDTLKAWMKSQSHLPSLDDEMLIHMLHACYYNVEQAKITTETLYTFKNTMPEFFSNWDINDADIQELLNNVILVAPLPLHDSEGNRVMICKLNDNDPTKYNFCLCVKWILMLSYLAIWDAGTQYGYVLVYDATGFTMSHLLKSPLSGVRNYINFGEKASPIRVHKVVMINTGPVVKKLMTLVRPFLSKELINMISFHTSYESFFKNLSKENIPSDYGGDAPSLSSLHRENVDKMLSYREWFLKEEQIRCDDSKRAPKSKASPTKVEKPFQKLEID